MPISCAATWLRSASLRTSAATTAKPLPCSPARAASIAAFSASRFVWYAMSSMMLIFCAICFIAATVALHGRRRPRPASRAALVAMLSVTLAFSVFCAMDAVICSMEALVSSTPAACSLAACDSVCAVELTSSARAGQRIRRAVHFADDHRQLQHGVVGVFLHLAERALVVPVDGLGEVAFGQRAHGAHDVVDAGAGGRGQLIQAFAHFLLEAGEAVQLDALLEVTAVRRLDDALLTGDDLLQTDRSCC